MSSHVTLNRSLDGSAREGHCGRSRIPFAHRHRSVGGCRCLPVLIGATSAAAADRRATPVDRPRISPGRASSRATFRGMPAPTVSVSTGTVPTTLRPARRRPRGPVPERAGRAPVPGGPGAPPGAAGPLPRPAARPSGLPAPAAASPLRGAPRARAVAPPPASPVRPWLLRAGPAVFRPRSDGDFPRPGRHGPSAATGSPDIDRAHPRPGRRAPSRSTQAFGVRSPAAAATPSRPSPSRRFDVADRFTRRSYDVAATPDARPEGLAPHRRARMTTRRQRRPRSHRESPGPGRAGSSDGRRPCSHRFGAGFLRPAAAPELTLSVVSRETARIRCFT